MISLSDAGSPVRAERPLPSEFPSLSAPRPRAACSSRSALATALCLVSVMGAAAGLSHAADATSSAAATAATDAASSAAASASPSTATDPASSDAAPSQVADASDPDGGGTALQEVKVSASAIKSQLTQTDMVALHDIPTSISVVSGAELEQTGAVDITDVLQRIGNASFDFGNPRTGSLTMRGITTGTSDIIDPSVGAMVDGVSYAYNPLITGLPFFDINNVNVTRGPQGTEGGKNSSIGEIEVTSNLPSFTPEADASLAFGNYDTVRAEADAAGGLIDDLLAFRVSFFRDEENGAYLNAFDELAGRASYDSIDVTAGRAQLLFTPFSGFSARIIVQIQPNGSEYINGLTFKLPTPDFYANGAPVNQALQPVGLLSRSWFTQESSYSYADYLAYPVDDDNNGAIITGLQGYTSLLQWNLGKATLSSVTGYVDSYFSAANDEGTPFDITDDGGYITYYHQVSEEVRLASEIADFADYVTGIYYLETSDNSHSRTRYGSDAGAWYTSVAQYTTLDSDAAGELLMQDSLDRLYEGTLTLATDRSAAWYGHVNWHLTDPLTLTTGLRLTREDRYTVQSDGAADYGYGAALNPVSINNLQLGGFASNATTGALLAGNTTAQLNLADAVASEYFGVAPTGVPGAAYESLTGAEQAQVAAAKAVRLAQLGVQYAATAAQPYKGTLPTGDVSLSYKVDPSETAYLTWEHGAKAGVSQITGATVNGGISILVPAETSNSYELGSRSSLAGGTVVVNGDLFLDRIHDFQQTVYFFNPVTTALLNNGTLQYSEGVGSVPRAETKGLEVDAAYNGIKNFSFKLSGAYTDAYYTDFPNAAQPAEDANQKVAFRNVTGFTLPFASKLSFDLAGTYQVPVLGDKVFHATANYHYTGGYNSDTNLSAYAWVPGYGITDLTVGIARSDQRIDVSVQVKNLLNTDYAPLRTWNSVTPGIPRWYGIVISGKLD